MALGVDNVGKTDDHQHRSDQALLFPLEVQPAFGSGQALTAHYHVRPDRRPATASSSFENHVSDRSNDSQTQSQSSSYHEPATTFVRGTPPAADVERADNASDRGEGRRGSLVEDGTPCYYYYSDDKCSQPAPVPSLEQRQSVQHRPFALGTSSSRTDLYPPTLDSTRGPSSAQARHQPPPHEADNVHRPSLPSQEDARTLPTFSVPLSRPPPPPSTYHAAAATSEPQSFERGVDAGYHHRATYGWPYAHPHHQHHLVPGTSSTSHSSWSSVVPPRLPSTSTSTQAVGSSSRRTVSASSDESATGGAGTGSFTTNSLTATPSTLQSISTAPSTPQVGVVVKEEDWSAAYPSHLQHYRHTLDGFEEEGEEDLDEEEEDEGGVQRKGPYWRADRTPGRMFKCQLDKNCKAEFSRAEHLARHERKHTKEKPFICHCTKAFSRLDNWRQHKNSVHKDEAEDNIRTEDRLMQVHKLIQRRNNANKQAYINGETLAISAPPLDPSTLATTTPATTTAPAIHQQQTVLAGVVPHYPTVTHSPQVNSPYPGVYTGAVGPAYSSHTASPAIGMGSPYTSYDHDVGTAGPSYTQLRNTGSGRGGYLGAGPSALSHGQYWSSEDLSHSHSAGPSTGQQGGPGGSGYGLAETSGRAYVSVSPTQQGSQGGSPVRMYGGDQPSHAAAGHNVGSIVGMPPHAFSPGPASQAGRSNPSSQVGDANPPSSYYLPNTTPGGRPAPGATHGSHSSSSNSVRTVGSHGSPSPIGKTVQLPSVSLSHPGTPGPLGSEQEMQRHELLRARALAVVMNKPIEELEREAFHSQGSSNEAASLVQRYRFDASLGGAGSHPHFSPNHPPSHQGSPSPLRTMDPPATIGLAPHATFGSPLGSPSLEQYGSHPQYSLHPSHEPMYRLPSRPRSSNDMRNAIVLASAAAAAAASGDMATSSSSSTLASMPPSYSVTTPHLGHGSTTPLASVPPSPVVGYLMPPFYHQAGPRHLESPNLPSTPRMESTSGVGGPSGGAGGMMGGPAGIMGSPHPGQGASASAPGSAGRGTPGSNGKRRRDSTEGLFSMTKRVAY